MRPLDAPQSPHLGRVRWSYLATWLPLALAAVVIICFFAVWWSIHATPGDAYNYLAAGERLNAGHPLYALSPGDRNVELHPPYWTVPLLSPPFIAVIWRPLAALPSDLGVAVWWAIGILVMLIALGAMAARRRQLVGAAALILSLDIVYELGMGNVDPFLFAGAIAVWLLWRGGRWDWAAVLVGLMIGVKVTPAVLGVWLIAATGSRRVALVLAATFVATLLVGVVGAGPSATADYVSVMRATEAVGASPISLSGLTGVTLLTPLFAALSIVAVFTLRRRPGLAFGVAIIGWVLGNPSLHAGSLGQLVTGLAPLCWPLPGAASAAIGGSPLRMPRWKRQRDTLSPWPDST